MLLIFANFIYNSTDTLNFLFDYLKFSTLLSCIVQYSTLDLAFSEKKMLLHIWASPMIKLWSPWGETEAQIHVCPVFTTDWKTSLMTLKWRLGQLLSTLLCLSEVRGACGNVFNGWNNHSAPTIFFKGDIFEERGIMQQYFILLRKKCFFEINQQRTEKLIELFL